MNFRSQRRWWLEAVRIARRLAVRGCSDQAADLAQDMAVTALERGDRTERAGAWLERVARNAVIDRHRKEQRRRRLRERAIEPPPVQDPEASLLEREQAALLRRAMGTLSPAQRRIAELRFGEELALNDVAARLGMVPATARSRLHRALVALRRQLEQLRATLVFGWPGVQTAALSVVVVLASTSAAPPVAPSEQRMAQAPVTAARGSFRPVDHPVRRREDDGHDRDAVGAPTRVTRRPGKTASAPQTVQTFRFDDDDVAGEHDAPAGDFIQAAPTARHGSLIELRATLVPEIAKSVEDL